MSEIATLQLLINGKERIFEKKLLNVEALINQLDLAGKRLAIEVNGEIVPRSQFAEKSLKNGDRLEIVGAVGGG